jgi:predicted anti-sigma-YlaC factor YlaD
MFPKYVPGLKARLDKLLGGAPAADHRVIENKGGDALPKDALKAVSGSRRERKARLRAATAELAAVDQVALVHVQPAWLREAVGELLDAGARIDRAALDDLRREGPQRVARIVAHFKEANS